MQKDIIKILEKFVCSIKLKKRKTKAQHNYH